MLSFPAIYTSSQAPVTWAIDPFVGVHWPALLEFYSANATFNDTFHAGPSGYGYAYPFDIPTFPQYAATAGAGIASSFISERLSYLNRSFLFICLKFLLLCFHSLDLQEWRSWD